MSRSAKSLIAREQRSRSLAIAQRFCRVERHRALRFGIAEREGNVFWARCAAIAASKLEMALSMISQPGTGILLYEMQDARGIKFNGQAPN
jgi:GTP cyclohydrolase II